MIKLLNFFKQIYRNIINRLEDMLGLTRTVWDTNEVSEKDMGTIEKCIDISKHQTSFNAAACKQQGVTTVLCRLAYGSSEDKCLNAHIGGVITGGMKHGGYGFGTWHYKDVASSYAVAREVMKVQVTKWIELAKKYACISWIGIDQELETDHKMNLNKEDNTELLCEAAQMIENAGFHPCLYASASWIMERVDLNKFTWPLWVAYYKDYGHNKDFCDVSTAFPSGRYGDWMNQYKDRICIWQFTSEGYADKYGCVHVTNDLDKDWLYYQPDGEVVSDTNVNVVYFAQYTGNTVSIMQALASLGEQNSYDYRKQIAAVNGFTGYKGAPEQNTHMLNLLKSGKLIKPTK